MIFTSPLADFLARVNNASKSGVARARVKRSKYIVRLSVFLASTGLIRGANIGTDYVDIYVKYTTEGRTPKFVLISRPGRRMFLSLRTLTHLYNKTSVSNYYVLSTDLGFVTSQESILLARRGGEVLFKVLF